MSRSETLAVDGRDGRPLIAHVLHRFDVGGLENGVVNLLNRMPRERFRHAVIALTDVTAFRHRVRRDDVTFIELHKGPGHGFKLFPRLARLFGELRPAIVHTRNLAALEAAIPAWYARVPIRVHGEHGRDVGDLDGSNRTYRIVRRVHRPFVTQYVAVSRDLQRYLIDAIGVRAARVSHIVNGVDTDAFRPGPSGAPPAGFPFRAPEHWICGAVGRLQPVKNQTLLARAFVRALERVPALRERLRLVVVGDGPLRGEIADILARGGASDLAWLPGARDDVARILGALDVFVLPSLAEGISNTILEAMATGLPVIASNVGGNRELVEDGVTGALVAAGDADALAGRLLDYAGDPQKSRRAGRAGRARAERLYSLDAMVAQYTTLYDGLMRRRGGAVVAAAAPAGVMTRSR
jgi:sugar transferase (PEP-CTERM/EpsH1 system associated)